MNVVHSDIKPDNILVGAGNTVKIADFGLAQKVNRGEKLFNKCGSLCFVSPETLNNQGYNTNADLFSLGSVLFFLATNSILFYSSDTTTTLELNKKCDLNPYYEEMR